MCEVLNIVSDDCGSNIGGTKGIIFIAKRNDFLTFAQPAGGANEEDNFIITDSHTFKPDKSWGKIEIVRDTGVNNMDAGGANSGAKNANLTFKVASKNPKALAMFNTLANGITPLIFLAEDANMEDGSYDQIGTEKFPAVMTASKNNGTNAGDGSMYEFTVTNVQPARIIYKGAVPLTGATEEP